MMRGSTLWCSLSPSMAWVCLAVARPLKFSGDAFGLLPKQQGHFLRKTYPACGWPRGGDHWWPITEGSEASSASLLPGVLVFVLAKHPRHPKTIQDAKPRHSHLIRSCQIRALPVSRWLQKPLVDELSNLFWSVISHGIWTGDLSISPQEELNDRSVWTFLKWFSIFRWNSPTPFDIASSMVGFPFQILFLTGGAALLHGCAVLAGGPECCEQTYKNR